MPAKIKGAIARIPDMRSVRRNYFEYSIEVMRLRHFIVSMRKYTEAAAILSVKNVRWETAFLVALSVLVR